MAITRIKNNQITDSSTGNVYLGINAGVKLQDYSITAGKIANSLVYGSDLTVSGNLTVNGTTTTIDTVSVVIEDPILLLAANQSGAPSLDIGFIGERGSSQNIAFVWDESQGEFVTVFTNDTTTNTTVTIASYASFHTNDANIGGNIVINGTTSLVGNIITDAAITGNVRAGNLSTVGQISATGNITGGNLVSNAAVIAAGNISTTTGNISGGNISTTGNIDATGNVTAGNLISSGAVIGNVTITGNLALGNLSVSGQINTTGNITGGNLVSNAAVSAATTVSATGNVTGGNVVSNASVSAATTVSATGNITGGNLISNAAVVATGLISSGANISATGNIFGGNITANSTLYAVHLETTGNATIGGNLVVQGNLTYINIDDLRVEDPIIIMGTGANGAPLTSDDGMDRGIYMEYYKAATGKGNASVFWDNSTGNVVAAANVNFSGNNIVNVVQYGTFQAGNIYAESVVSVGNISGPFVAPGSNTQILFNNNGLIAGDAGITYDATTDALTVLGNITGGNISTGGRIDATGNINTSANLNALSGNINAQQLYITGNGTVIGTFTSTSNIVANVSGIFFGQAPTGNLAIQAGVAGFTPLGSNIVAQFSGNTNSYSQINFENINAGPIASTDYVATADNGTDSTFFIDMGIGSSTHDDPAFFGDTSSLNDGYLYVVANAQTGGSTSRGNLMLGSTNGNVKIFVGNTAEANVRAVASTQGIDITNGNLYVASITSRTGRVTVNSDSSDTDFAVNSDTTANIFYVDAGTSTASFGNSTQVANAVVSFQSSNSILIPRGNSAQRPATGVTGMIRFNTTLDSLEFYDADSWVSAGTVFTVIDSEVFNGDGSTVAYTLGTSQTTDSCIVSINGVLQIPVLAYSVTGNVLTFTEAPLVSDTIEVREITTTTTVKGISNANGNAAVEVVDTDNDVRITGDLIPTANVTFDLGSSALRWRDGYFSGNSITLGNIVLKNTSGNTLAFFGPDGTTPGTLSSNNVDTTTIANGTSNVSCATSNGNVNINVGGSGIVSFTSAGINNLQANGVGNIGTSSSYFNTIFAKATSAQYADLAEMYAADTNLEPGTVVCFGGSAEVTGCTEEACKRVAGVISTNPSYIMNSALEGDHIVAVALTGRVPTRVTGPVRKGDMMVSTADGRARAEPDPRVGTVIGKALEDFDGTEGVIEVVVGRL